MQAWMTGRPSKLCWRCFTTKMGWVHSQPLYCSVEQSPPVTFIGLLLGPCSLLVRGLSWRRGKDVHGSSEIVVTSAPVFTLKGTLRPSTRMVQFHMVAWSALMHGWYSDRHCCSDLLHQAPWLCQKPNCGSTVRYVPLLIAGVAFSVTSWTLLTKMGSQPQQEHYSWVGCGILCRESMDLSTFWPCWSRDCSSWAALCCLTRVFIYSRVSSGSIWRHVDCDWSRIPTMILTLNK